jgi:hypothetical protein
MERIRSFMPNAKVAHLGPIIFGDTTPLLLISRSRKSVVCCDAYRNLTRLDVLGKIKIAAAVWSSLTLAGFSQAGRLNTITEESRGSRLLQ